MPVNAFARIDPDQSMRRTRLIECPNCGQKLTDVEVAEGEVVLRQMCRRCRQYVKIKIQG